MRRRASRRLSVFQTDSGWKIGFEPISLRAVDLSVAKGDNKGMDTEGRNMRTKGPAIMCDGITFYGSKALRQYQERKARRELKRFDVVLMKVLNGADAGTTFDVVLAHSEWEAVEAALDAWSTIDSPYTFRPFFSGPALDSTIDPSNATQEA